MRAADYILRKALVAADIPSREWSAVQAGLRNRAFFMSRVTSERILHEARQGVRDRLEKGKSASEVRRDLRGAISLPDRPEDPAERGTIRDIYTKRRLDVMIEQNARQAKGYADHLRATTGGALLAFPGYALVRERQSREPRDWDARWRKAAEAVGWRGVNRKTAEKVALKTSPIWVKLSAFGNPFPPFDWGSGMGLDDVERERCAALGLVGGGIAEQRPPRLDLNGHLEMAVSFRDDSAEAGRLRELFGDQVEFRGNAVRWRGELIRDVIAGREKKVSLGVGYNGERTSLSHRFFADHASKHFGENETHGLDAPMTEGDYELLPALWRSPDRVEHDGRRKTDRLELDMLDGSVLTMFVRRGHGPVTVYKKAAGSTVERMHAVSSAGRPQPPPEPAERRT